MPKYLLVSDLLNDLMSEDGYWGRASHLLHIINEEWEKSNIKIFQRLYDAPEPIAWESLKRKIYPTMESAERIIRCFVIRNVFEDPYISDEDLQYVKRVAAAAGLTLAEQSNDTEIQPSQPNGAALSTQGETSSEAAAARGGTIKQNDEGGCKEWLIGLMKGTSRPDKSKRSYFDYAHSKFGISRRSFDHDWRQAIIDTKNKYWSKPGRKS